MVVLEFGFDLLGPRALLGLPPRDVQIGQPAELILFDWEPSKAFRLRATVIGDAAV